jgi:lysophospholipase L1-like esterase
MPPVRRLAVAFGCLVLASELGLRLFDHFQDVPSGSLYSTVDTTAEPYRLVPGTDLVMPERYGDIRYTINRTGYRDREWGEPGRPLIVVVGDSVAFGLSAGDRERFPEQLEDTLRAGPWPQAEVRNLSVFGYGGYEELAALRQFGLPANPDLVIVQFYQNDLHTPAPTFSLRQRATLGQRLHAVANRLLTASNLYRRVSQQIGGVAYRLRHDARRQDPNQLNAAEPQQVVDLLAAEPMDEKLLAFGFLDEMRRDSEQAGARFLVLSTPNEAQLFFDRWDDIDRRLASFAAARGIPLLDTLEALRADHEREQLFRDGVHLSPTGHRRVADILAPRVEALLATGAWP